jgi:hypothetical protein
MNGIGMMNNMNGIGMMNNMNGMGMMNNMNGMGMMNNMNGMMNNMNGMMNNMNGMGMMNNMNGMGMMNNMNGMMNNMNGMGMMNNMIRMMNTMKNIGMTNNLNGMKMGNSIDMINKNMVGKNSFNPNINGNSLGSNEPPKEIIPRSDASYSVDYYKNNNQGNKLNITLKASSGLSIVMPTPPNVLMKTMKRNYIKRLGLDDSVLNGAIIFLFNAKVINYKDDIKLISEFFKNKEINTITVIDVNNIIAA